MRSMVRLLLVTATLAGAALTADAQALREAPSAASKQDVAAQHFQLGLKFYRAGDHAAARVEFEAALGLSGEADLLHNLRGQQRSRGRSRRPLTTRSAFLRSRAPS